MTTKNTHPLSEIKDEFTTKLQPQEYRLKPRESLAPSVNLTPSQKKVHRLVWGDSAFVIQALLDVGFSQAFDFIYIDPPFNTGTTFHRRNHLFLPQGKTTTIDQVAYSDTWGGQNDGFLHMLYLRVKLMKLLLKKGGVLAVHCDHNASAHLKLMLDGLFGEANYVNTIIWRRTNSPKAQSTHLGTQYDTIHIYTTDMDSITINPVYKKYTKQSLRPYSYEDEHGAFRLIELEAKGRQRHAGRKEFEFQGRIAPWLYKKETLEKWWKNGHIYVTKNQRYCRKQYLHNMPGTLVSDLWVDDEVAPLQGISKENTKYPTQKPENLLHRLITMFSTPGDLIGDFFVGSGTTPVVATKLGRNWICSDLSRLSINITKYRFWALENPSLTIESLSPMNKKTLEGIQSQLQRILFEHLKCEHTQFPGVGENKNGLVVLGSPFEEIQANNLLETYTLCSPSSPERINKLQVIGWQYAPTFTEEILNYQKIKGSPQVEAWIAPDSLVTHCDDDLLKRHSLQLLPRPEIQISITKSEKDSSSCLDLQKYRFHHPPINGINQEELDEDLSNNISFLIESISLDPNFIKLPYHWSYHSHVGFKTHKEGSHTLFPFSFTASKDSTIIVKFRDFYGTETLTACSINE
ncbi:MAG: DNA methyltransferase [Candidatus Ranarchaeia archaeon]|jgi:DNA modification methylase